MSLIVICIELIDEISAVLIAYFQCDKRGVVENVDAIKGFSSEKINDTLISEGGQIKITVPKHQFQLPYTSSRNDLLNL